MTSPIHGLTTPNASPIETHVNCLNSAGRFHHFSPYAAYSVAYQDKAWNVFVQKQARWGMLTSRILSYAPWSVERSELFKFG